MRKRVGIIKRASVLLLVILMSINSFAAIVSDNDGSAFITKAEFDALKSSFQSQIDSYNQSIDSKIDGAIASYLAGIKLSTKQELPSIYGNGIKLYPKTDITQKNVTTETAGLSIKWGFNGNADPYFTNATAKQYDMWTIDGTFKTIIIAPSGASNFAKNVATCMWKWNPSYIGRNRYTVDSSNNIQHSGQYSVCIYAVCDNYWDNASSSIDWWQPQWFGQGEWKNYFPLDDCVINNSSLCNKKVVETNAKVSQFVNVGNTVGETKGGLEQYAVLDLFDTPVLYYDAINTVQPCIVTSNLGVEAVGSESSNTSYKNSVMGNWNQGGITNLKTDWGSILPWHTDSNYYFASDAGSAWWRQMFASEDWQTKTAAMWNSVPVPEKSIRGHMTLRGQVAGNFSQPALPWNSNGPIGFIYPHAIIKRTKTDKNLYDLNIRRTDSNLDQKSIGCGEPVCKVSKAGKVEISYTCDKNCVVVVYSSPIGDKLWAGNHSNYPRTSAWTASNLTAVNTWRTNAPAGAKGITGVTNKVEVEANANDYIWLFCVPMNNSDIVELNILEIFETVES